MAAAVIVKMSAAGSSTAGLLHYVYGPGKGEARGGTVHVNPRTVAAWDGAPSLHSPVPIPGRGRTGSGVSVKALARSLDDPVSAAAGSVPAAYVGHIIVANHPDDPVLTDGQWAEIAGSTMANAGLSAGPDDPAGVRWIAVRHDDTSIHIVYTKAREDGTAAPKFINFTKAWQGMRHDFERRFGLTFTGKADGTARRPYGQVEATRAKAARAAGDGTARPETAELRHLCRVVSAEVTDVDTYLTRLEAAGVNTSVERDDDGQLVSYRVGLSSRPDGEPILYDAAKLASELAPAALGERWAGVDEEQGLTAGDAAVAGAGVTPPPETVIRDAATVALRSASTRLDQLADEDAEAYAAAAGDFLHSAAAVTGDDVLRDAAESYTRAGRTTQQDQTQARPAPERTSRGDLARELRAASSMLSALARLVPPEQRPDRDAARLIMATAAVVASVRAWHDLNLRSGQAAAAATARRQLHAGEAAIRARTRVASRPAAVAAPVKPLGRPVPEPTRYEPPTQGPDRGRGR